MLIDDSASMSLVDSEPTAQERGTSSTKATSAARREERMNRPPSWRSAFNRSVVNAGYLTFYPYGGVGFDPTANFTNGPTGTVKMAFLKSSTRFETIEGGGSQPD